MIPPSPERAEDLPFEEDLPFRIVRPYRARFEESIAGDTIRTAVALGWLADIAWQHSSLLGFGRDWYTDRGLFWLVRAVRLDVLAPIVLNREVRVSTQVVGYRRIAARRRGEIRGADGRTLARAEIHWVMTNDRGVPTRVPEEMMKFVADPGATFELLKLSLPAAPSGAYETGFVVHRRDVDPLDHVNNSVYLDYLEEALENAGQADLIRGCPRRYEMDFVAAAGRGEEVTGCAWPDGFAWLYRLSRPDGAELFRGTVRAL
jgi:medium-chain acyl-[acyl-carrier-protein] hydrolase